MGRASDLLRMLEPAVRPGSFPAARSVPPTAGAAPIESRGFESILEEAQQMARQPPEISEDSGVVAAPGKPADPLAGLAGVDRIENAALRQIVTGAAKINQPQADHGQAA